MEYLSPKPMVGACVCSCPGTPVRWKWSTAGNKGPRLQVSDRPAGVYVHRSAALSVISKVSEEATQVGPLKRFIDVPKPRPKDAEAWILWDLDNKCPKVRLIE
eukprot:7111933-Pyramimonas_sp.AAC.1